MKVVIFGMGYVGLTSAVCLAASGHRIVGVEISRAKTAALAAGESPIFEPGLAEILSDAVGDGRIRVVSEIGDELADADVAIVCVGTPSAADGSHDMSHIIAVSRQIASATALLPPREPREPRLVVMFRSTMRPGSIEDIVAPTFLEASGRSALDVDLVYNPEFLRESTAIKDYNEPPKIVVGTSDGKPNAIVEALFAGIDAPRFHVGYREAELTKFVDNSFHALKVAFANEIGRVCRAEKVDAGAVHAIFIADTKLNISPYYLRPGGPFGGSCLPKDLRALNHIARSAGQSIAVLDAIIPSNEAHKAFLFEIAVDGLATGSRVLLNGLSFKANSDDLRESPHVDLAERLIAAGFDLCICEPLLRLEKLVGANQDYLARRLPGFEKLLVSDISTMESRRFDRVIDVRGDAAELPIGEVPIVRLDRLA